MSTQTSPHDPHGLEILVLHPVEPVDPLVALRTMELGAYRRGSWMRLEDLVATGHCGVIERQDAMWFVLPGHFDLASDPAMAKRLEALSPKAWAKVRTRDGHGETVVWGERPNQSALHSLEQACGLGLGELLGLEVVELLPEDYALAADPRVRVPATADPQGEAKLTRQILAVLTLALVGAGLWFAFAG